MWTFTRAGRLAVILIWVVLLGYLIRERMYDASVTPRVQDVSRAGQPKRGEIWMGVYMQGRKIGYTHTRFSPHRDGYRFEQQSVLRLNILDTRQTVRVMAAGETDGDYALQSFSASLRSGVGDFAVRGRIDGRQLSLSTDVDGSVTEQQISLDGPIFLPAGARAHISQSDLRPGNALTLQVFDPSTLQHQPMQLRVERREPLEVDGSTIDTWRVSEELRGLKTTVWLDEEGEVIREEGPLNLVLSRESPEEALAVGWEAEAALDLMAVVAIPVKREISAPRELRRMEVRLNGIADVPVPTDARQTHQSDRWVIAREDAALESSYTLPYRGAQWRADTQATPFLQTEHPRIRAAAMEALGGETDARRAAERLRRWVFERLRKAPTVSVPNALQVLSMGVGDCNEHAVLLAALARAAGMPARVVAGVVYMGGVFLYHAWNEVWLGSGWVSVDATLDQMPADATHLKLVEGGPEDHGDILPVIGRLSIDVLEAG